MRGKVKWITVALLLTIVLLVGSLGCGSTSPGPTGTSPSVTGTPQSQTAITWTLYHCFIPGAFNTATLAIPNTINKATSGRLKINMVSDIIDYAEMDYAASDGRAQAAIGLPNYHPKEWPIGQFSIIPFFFQSFQEYKDISDKLWTPILYKEYAKQFNLEMVVHASWAPRMIFANRAINTVEDWKGLRLRSSGGLTAQVLNRVGATAIYVQAGEVYTGIQRGTIDGAFLSVGSGLNYGLAEVAKYINQWEVDGGFDWCVVVNRKAWDSLPEDLKPAVKDAFKKIEENGWKTEMTEFNNSVVLAKAANVELVVPSDQELNRVKQWAPEIWNGWVSDSAKAGSDGAGLLQQTQDMLKTMRGG